MGVEPALQDEDGGDLVDDILSVARGPADGIEMAVGLGGAEALIPQVNGQIEFGAEGVGKFFRGKGARAAVAGEMNRPSHDNFRAGIASQQTPQRAEIVARIGMDEGEQGLGGEAELVGQGDADAPRTVIEAENAWNGLRDGRRGRGCGWLHEGDGN